MTVSPVTPKTVIDLAIARDNFSDLPRAARSASGRLANNSACRSVAATRSESVTETFLILTHHGFCLSA